jgi:hypothetical protein
MKIIKYIRKILRIPKELNFGRLEKKIRFEPAKLLAGGGFTSIEYPEAFKTNSDGAVVISRIYEYAEVINIRTKL